MGWVCPFGQEAQLRMIQEQVSKVGTLIPATPSFSDAYAGWLTRCCLPPGKGCVTLKGSWAEEDSAHSWVQPVLTVGQTAQDCKEW
jgi:hypothetical protein